MRTPSILKTARGREIAFHRTDGEGPGVVFLGGFQSDMTGTKATALEEWAQARGRAFVRFDYSGHGQSSGAFAEGCIGDWAEDAMAIVAATEGPQVLVGSSMGGWISSLVIRAMPGKVCGFVGVAAAPDFTEDAFWAGFDAVQRRQLEEEGQVWLPSDYGDPFPVTKRLIEDGRRNLVLRVPLKMPFPVRLLQGDADEVVPREVALRLFDHITGPDVRLTIVKGVDHRFSEPENLAQIIAAVEEVAG